MTWTIRSTVLNNNTIRFQIAAGGVLLSVAEVMRAWQQDEAFRRFYNRILAQADFPAFFWELPPMTRSGTAARFEFVLVNSASLARVQAERRAFQTHFNPGKAVVVFSNLSGDATLVVPTPLGPDHTYAHLAQFVRNAPESQIDAFWQEVGMAYEAKLSSRPLWLSTSGLGVYWLHVRLDDRPKYYSYGPYSLM